MAHVQRFNCSRCGQSIYNCHINGVRVPLLFYMVVSQPPDTGPALEMNAPGVLLPQFVREMMKAPVPRIELCMMCVVNIFGMEPIEAGPEWDGEDLMPLPQMDELMKEGLDMTQVDMVHKARALKAVARDLGRTIPETAEDAPLAVKSAVVKHLGRRPVQPKQPLNPPTPTTE